MGLKVHLNPTAPPLARKLFKDSSTNFFFKKCSKSKSNTNSKPGATPIFCEQNFSQMQYFGIMNLLTFVSTVGDQHFA